MLFTEAMTYQRTKAAAGEKFRTFAQSFIRGLHSDFDVLLSPEQVKDYTEMACLSTAELHLFDAEKPEQRSRVG